MSTTAKNIANLCTNDLKICYGYVIFSMGLIAEMYKEIPEKFQPTEIVGSQYIFPDGTYSSAYVRDFLEPTLTELVGVPGRGIYNNSVVLVDALQGENVLQGIRRVRNVVAEVQQHVYSLQGNYTLLGRYSYDICIARQGQNVIYEQDVLARYDGNWFYVPAATGGNPVIGDEDDIRICYPGVAELQSGDRLLLRIQLLAYRNYAQTAFEVSFCSSVLTRFA